MGGRSLALSGDPKNKIVVDLRAQVAAMDTQIQMLANDVESLQFLAGVGDAEKVMTKFTWTPHAVS